VTNRSLALAAFVLIGCGSSCPPSERVVADGERWQTTERKSYRTSPPEGPFLPFDGATVLHVRHGLGQKPDFYQVQLSFSERPLQSGGGGSAFAAGNQVVLQKIDETEIIFRNDSCASYYIQVTVSADVRK
jgi:hypothetical protein